MANHSKDYWSSKAYSNAAGFVPQLTTKVLQYLDPQPTDDILDIGCGDGILDDKIAPLCHSVVGLDSSQSMIQTANETIRPNHSNTEFMVTDCRRVNAEFSQKGGQDLSQVLQADHYDKVFSNAAMHWILSDEKTRVPYFSDVYKLVKPGGTFVFEMGGFENVAEVHAALYSVLRFKYNVPLEKIKAVDPWFFPSTEWMRATLEGAGFTVENIEMEHRPTKLTQGAKDGSGGAEGWFRLMAGPFFQVLNEGDIDGAITALCEATERTMTKVEDDSQWLSYVRLRAVARK